MRYKKKPIVVEAVQFINCYVRAIEECFNEVPKWLHEAFEEQVIYRIPRIDIESQSFLRISTIEGNMDLTQGNWLIKGVKGELYPCNDEIFRMTYEEVKDEKLED